MAIRELNSILVTTIAIWLSAMGVNGLAAEVPGTPPDSLIRRLPSGAIGTVEATGLAAVFERVEKSPALKARSMESSACTGPSFEGYSMVTPANSTNGSGMS